MRKSLSKNTLLLVLLLFAILIMGIGYSSINSITGEIKGTVIADMQQGVFITNVEYMSDVDANLSASEIQYYKGTFMQNTVELSGTNAGSEITYKVTVYNNSENSYPFLAVLYDEEFYDNSNIIFEISADGYKIGDIINPHETKDIYITFKYKDGVIPNNTVLNSYLNFKIAEPNRLMMASYSSSTSNYLRGTIAKDKIETIQFSLGNITPEGTTSNFDASEKQDKSIIGYYTDTDGNGLYELTFASNEPIFANINAQYLFQNLTRLKNISFDNFSTLGVTSMYGMFYNCSGLTSLDVSKFDTSLVTNMDWMFYRCSGLTSLDVSKFDTSQVTGMYRMFANCSGLTSLDLSNFNTSKVTNMEYMFGSCTGLTTLDVSNFNTSQVTNMLCMFWNCSSLTTLDVSGFNTSKVTNMESMFSTCTGLTTLDVSGFITDQVTTMYAMFYNCSSLTELDVSRFNTSQVTNMLGMFYNCSSLTELDVSNFNTSQVTNMLSMFNHCSSLTTLDVSGFNTSKVTIMESMFSSCTGLTTIYASEFNAETNTGWITSAVTSSADMFTGSTKIVGGNGTTYDSSHINKEYARIDKPGAKGYFTDIKYKNYKKPSDLFDNEGTNPDGLHIGDFIQYDAGTWTQEEIDAIQTGLKTNLVTANGSKTLPNTAFQFGNFLAGSSRNGSLKNEEKWSVKDKSTGTAITGWRVFDIEGDKITLISAGAPESYYPGEDTNYGYINEYILTGNVNSSWSGGTTASANYQKRDWSNYINTVQKAESAIPLTKSRLDNWYTKYTNTPNADTYTDETFQKIYTNASYHRYQNMIDNAINYWLSEAGNRMAILETCFDFGAGMVGDPGGGCNGVRLLVTLSSDILLEKTGTKTVTGGNTTDYGGDQTYNTWDLTENRNNILTAETLTEQDYGGTVTNYKPTNGSTVGWRIFHTDGENIYLIADNYITNSSKPKGKNGTTYSSSNGTYGANLAAAKDYNGISDINSNLKTKWLSKYTYSGITNYNAKASAYLLDTNAWQVFKDSTGYAEYAVGAPTLELFTASYNATHSTKIDTRVSSATGYQMKWSTGSTYGTEVANIDDKDELYVINNLYSRTVFGTWIASPNAYGVDRVVLARGKDTQNYSNPKVNYAAYTSNGGGIRPIVVLKPEYGVQKQSDGTYLIKK